MTLRQRGQEITVRIAVDGVVQPGSFFKVTEWTTTPRTDIMEESFLGELEDDLDIQHHGFDFSFTVQIQDQAVLEFLSTIIDREQRAVRHPDISITVIHVFRERDARNQTEVFHDVFLKVNEFGFSGRKEYTTASFEGKAKRRTLLPGP